MANAAYVGCVTVRVCRSVRSTRKAWRLVELDKEVVSVCGNNKGAASLDGARAVIIEFNNGTLGEVVVAVGEAAKVKTANKPLQVVQVSDGRDWWSSASLPIQAGRINSLCAVHWEALGVEDFDVSCNWWQSWVSDLGDEDPGGSRGSIVAVGEEISAALGLLWLPSEQGGKARKK